MMGSLYLQKLIMRTELRMFLSQSLIWGKHYWETTAQCGPDLAGSQIGIVGSDNESLVSWALIQASENYFGLLTDGARR